MKQNYIIKLMLVSFIFLGSFSTSLASESNIDKSAEADFFIRLDKATIAKGYTVEAYAKSIRLSLVPGILSESTTVDIKKLSEVMTKPWRLERLSPIYQYEFKNKSAYRDYFPFYIQLSYDNYSDSYKQLFFFDKNYNTWRPLPSQDYLEEKFLRSLIHLPFARIAVFAYPKTLIKGRASWYGYKGGAFAASPDFPASSRLRVFNTENNKFIDVVVNDYGPDRSVFPNRSIDLDKLAFSRLALLDEGVINVRIEPLYIASDLNGRILSLESKGAKEKPNPSAASALVLDTKNNKVIFEKNATTSLPIASLSKIMSMYIYLQQSSDLDKIIIYHDSDANYNYEYASPWELAKLNLSEGEELSVKDLLYSSLIASANNTVETLVRASGLSRDKFIAKMNAQALSWGASSTHFVEPTGLSPDNISSARDYALIASNALKNRVLKNISSTEEYIFYTHKTKIYKRIRNSNHLIRSHKYKISASKTGYLDEAKYCLMTEFDTNNNPFLVVLLGAETRSLSFSETSELWEYAVSKL